MKKEIKCKFCGGRHYQYQCWRKKRQEHENKIAIKSHESHQKHKKHKKSRNNTMMDRKALIHDLDKIVSEMVRKKGAKDGINTCYTCGRRLHWKNLDCGHYISRRYIGTRFDFENMRPQCRVCNRELHGNLETYDKKLRKELGNEKVNELWLKALNEHPMTVELEELLEKLTRERRYDNMVL